MQESEFVQHSKIRIRSARGNPNSPTCEYPNSSKLAKIRIRLACKNSNSLSKRKSKYAQHAGIRIHSAWGNKLLILYSDC